MMRARARARLAGLLRYHDVESDGLVKASRDQEGTEPRLI
jgi:hypothetical protein